MINEEKESPTEIDWQEVSNRDHLEQLCESELVIRLIHAKAKESGGVGKFEKAVGPEAGYQPNTKWLSQMLSNSNSKRRCSLEVAEACANHLDMTLAELVCEAQEHNRIQLSTPGIVNAVINANGNGISSEMLDQLERLRREDPKLTIRLIGSIARKIDPVQKVAVLSVLIDCYRALIRFPEATRAFQLAFQLALEEEKPDLMLKIGYIPFESHDFQTALEIAEKASSIYANSMNISGVVETQIYRASILNDMGESENALMLLKRSDEYQVRKSYVASRLFLRARIDPNVNQDELFEKSYNLWLELGDKTAASKVLWAKGMIQGKLELVRRAIKMFPEYSAVERALASLDLSILLFDHGETEQCMRVCREAFGAVDRLKNVPGIEEALTTLSRYGVYQNSKVSIAKLSAIRKRVALCCNAHSKATAKRIRSLALATRKY